MACSEETKFEQESQKKSNSRRTILKRASAGVVLTTLPAQSVWGAVCTLSGAQSGNMSGIQRHVDCNKPNLSNGAGRPPANWQALVNGETNTLSEVFTNSPQVKLPSGKFSAEDEVIRTCYMRKILKVANKFNLVRKSRRDLINPYFVNNIFNALTYNGGLTGSFEYKLAAVWLNCYFGLYDESWVDNRKKASRKVEQFVAWTVIQENAGSGLTIEQSDYQFSGGATNYTKESCDSK